MGDIVPFKPAKKISSASGKKPGGTSSITGKLAGNTLCKSGFHKWKTDTSTNFSVRDGKLLTRRVCERCGAAKTEYT